MYKFLSAILILGQLQFAIATRAQGKYFVSQLDNSDGLSNSCITAIFQDSDHLLWIGTWDGLNVYDGTSFHVFNYGTGERNNNLSNNIILQIKEDRKKNIWINTMDGISRYDKASGKFHHYFYDQTTSKIYLKRKSVLFADNRQNIYCVSKTSSTLYKYDPQMDRFSRVLFKDNDLPKSNILFDENGHLWTIDDFGTLKGFYLKNKIFYPFKEIKDNLKIVSIFIANHHLFYANVEKHLFEVDRDNNHQVLQLPFNPNGMVFYNNHYLICSALKGIGEYDSDFKLDNSLAKNVPLLKGAHITSLLAGDEKLLWLGTEGNGLIKFGKIENNIGLVQNLSKGVSVNTIVRSFFEINNDLWVGTKGNGLISIKNFGKSNQENPVINPAIVPAANSENNVYTIKKGNDGYVYVGSESQGITIYDPNKNKFIPYASIKNSANYPKFSSVHAILPDSDKSVWLGTSTYGLIHLKLKKVAGSLGVDYLSKYSNTGNTQNIGSDIVYALEEGSNSNIYIGCRFGGLTIYNKKSRSFRTIRAFSYNGSLSNNDVLSLHLSKNHRLWIGTSFGLNWIDESALAKPMPVFHSLNTEYGMPNNTIHAITEDNEGNIWVSTNKGLASIDQATLTIKQFKVSDGLQSNEFSDGAIYKSDNNELFFGGIYGFNYFKPQQIIHNSQQPNLLLSGLQPSGKFGESYKLTVIPANGNFKHFKYQLARQENFFELHLKAVKFRNADKCQYAYFLSNYDKIWHYLNEDGKIAYTGLPAGNYQLKVKWSNGEGSWSREIPALDIEIKQYFWLSLPAIAAYVVFLVSGLLLFFRYRKNKQTMLYNLSIEHMMREKDEQLHQEHLQFFTNIAHELQTPLTLITGSLERYMSKIKPSESVGNQNRFFDIVKQQASRLSYLVYQLLEFRKAETGHLKINQNYLNVSNLLINIIELFKPIKGQKNLELSCQFEPDMMMWTDKDKLEKIIFNLLSNAFKHTVPNQHIICSLNADVTGKNIELVVSNSGCTLTRAELDQLFIRFFVTDPTQQSKISTGIGLAFTKELVTLMQGKIRVECKNGWISFAVLLPLEVLPEATSRNIETHEKLDKPSFLLTEINNTAFPEHDVETNNKEALFENLINSGKKSILIIEDEPDIRYLLKDILKDQYVIYEADCGKTAIGLLTKLSPNLIISDVMMPDMSGLEVCNAVKNTPNICYIPFIILSARGSIEQQTEGYEAGADAYIPKPFNGEYLLVRIRKLLDYQQKLSDLFKQDLLTSHLNDRGLHEEDKIFLKSIISLIEGNLENESLNAEFIEKEVGVSRANLYRRLKILSNMTPGELILHLKIQNAAALLQASDLTVSEIIYKCGFNNRSYFFREFKKRYQTSPAEYRVSCRVPI